MKRSKVKYLRDARAIAVAWGAAVYDKRGMREKQLQPVHEAMLRPDFPKKTPFGWPKEDVLAWGTSHLELSKDRRTITRVEGREAKVEGVNSEPGSPQREFGFEEKLTRFSPDYQKRLIGLYDKWLNPNSLLNKSLTQSEKGELEKAGLIVAVVPETEGDGITGGVRGVANYIRNNFPGVVCNHMDISRWMRGEYLPSGCTENFPGPDERGAYPKTLVHPWVDSFLKKTATGQALNLEDPRQALELLELETKREEFRVWKQEHSDKYLLKETATRTGSTIGTVARNTAREAIEKSLPKRFANNFEAALEAGGLKMDKAGVEKLKLMLLERLREDCMAAFDDWQKQFTGQLGELTVRMMKIQ